MKQEWLLIDMHTHSGYSKINKKSDVAKVKEMKAEDFINELISHNVKVFSVTDHNYYSCDFYNELDEYIERNGLDIKVINGIEFDAYVDLEDGSRDFIHICVYFNNNVDRIKLENIVNSLYKSPNGEELQPDFVQILNELYELKTKFIVVPHGDKDRGLFKKHMIDGLNFNEVSEYYKYAMYKIFNAFDVSPGFFGKSEQFWATSFCEKTKKFEELTKDKSEEELNVIKCHISDIIKNKDITLTEEEQEIYNYVLKYGAYFSYFNFSDWHNAEPYNPKTNNFIFGSLDTAFESFEMATLDPVSRIILSQDTDIQIPSTILNKVNFNIKDQTKEIQFSPGLNAIVGKRGSGKSLLLSVIRNLVDKDDSQGALVKYRNLNVSNISGENRGGINISLGGLSSVAFLTQDEIKEIFENPDRAQRTISGYFKSIKAIDMSKINNIIAIGDKIVPINENYKNITSNILAIKKFSDYNYSIRSLLNDVDIKTNFTKLINELKDTLKNVEAIGLSTEELKEELNKLQSLQLYYLKMIEFYNVVIDNNNKRILDINSKRTNNQVTQRQNMIDIKNALTQIEENFAIQLNVEKMKFLLNNFSIENPPVEIFQKGKYLFATYYEIPENIKDILTEKITDTITRSNSLFDIDKYILKDPNRRLKANASSLVYELKKYVNNNIFNAKKEFYEIKNDSLDYKTIIKSMEDLNNSVNSGNLANLTNASPGMKSVAYLDMLFDLEETILILDQPEDNIDNDYISNYLVPNIKNKKKIKQLIFVTHNPSVAVYGDAFNYIFVENNDEITYRNFIIEKYEDKESLIKILEGGRQSFSNRNKKFGNVLGEEEYGNN